MERIVVPPSDARLIQIPAGQAFSITTPEDSQCVDFWAIHSLDEWASAEHTRVELMRLFPRVGDAIVTNKRREILLFEDDHSPGVHDMLVCTCDAERYRRLGAKGYHPSCEENFFKSVRAIGWQYPFLPQSINWFTTIPISGDGSLGLGPSPSRAGDRVVLRALLDCHVVVCSCAQDITEINGHKPTALWVDRIEDGSTEAAIRIAARGRSRSAGEPLTPRDA